MYFGTYDIALFCNWNFKLGANTKLKSVCDHWNNEKLGKEIINGVTRHHILPPISLPSLFLLPRLKKYVKNMMYIYISFHVFPILLQKSLLFL